jgi:serine/threonine protein kinase
VSADPIIGRTLAGRYEVLARLGAGSVGVVYQGRDVQLDRLVAIKVLQQRAAASPEWRRRFEREARALSALAHPNIVPVTASGIDGAVAYLVMELLQGRTLADLINEGPVAPERALDIVCQTLRGLAAAHDQAIAHRDLNPANIFLQATPDRADHVRLLDLGVTMFLESADSPAVAENASRAGAVIGTPAYMSPEQVRGERVDTRADIYAAGAILFQLLAGRPPYVAGTPEGVMKAHDVEPIPSLVKERPELSMARLVQPVIDRAMAKRPADRYPKALWMLSALEAIGPGAPVTSAGAQLAPSSPAARRARQGGSRPWRTAIAVVVLAASVITGVKLLDRHRGPESESARPVASQVPAANQQTPPTPPAPAPAQPPPPATAAATQTQTKPASAAARGKRARDPWQESVPEALKPIRESLERGTRLNEASLGPAYAYARQNPGDPRPWLLIGHVYSQINWVSDSVERYQRAYRADPTSRGDPQMLEDLLKAAAHRVAGPNAARVIRNIYGAEALPALDKAIERGGSDEDGIERLDHLRDALAE